ncbi:amidohydrolase family protein [Rheinheimera sp. 4Y26]|uniref:amidohydrolase family protein n=1 Tax=Rheinheimera sp. 4Y26 TaxID=2977811 RepID=UPI0021B13D6F|nr:amidohydrolase family protein [Rheinheimera sp. 4Y26]MCT6698146.1 amidohydrolase family protein [Rheinheimera sp. 4Y26]
MRLRYLAALLLASTALQSMAGEQRRYTILVDNGVKAGEQIVDVADNGELKVRFIFKDNGRGPELNESIKLNADGTIASYSGQGKSTFGSVINEKFERQGDNASWSTGDKKGQAKVTGSALYLPVDGSPELSSVAIAAIAKSGGNSMSLLPSGTLTQHNVGSLIVEKDGEKQQVQLLVQTGVGLEPNLVWATSGENPRLFASIAPGYLTLIEEGWQHNAGKMAQLQKQTETKLLTDLANAIPKDLPGLTVLRNVRPFDSVKAEIGAPSDLFILRGKITAIVPTGTLATKAQNSIDGKGRIVLPGLFDMHGHLSRWEGPLHLAAGVTTLRDMGNDNASIQAMISETAAGELLAPTVVPTGFLEGESPYSARNGFVIKDLAGAKSAIDWYAAHGYPQLKIYNSFPKAILKDTVAYAHQRGLRVSGHVPAFLKAEDVIAAGYDEIQHINQLLLNFLVKPDTDTRTLERFYLPAKQVASLDLQGKAVQDYIKLMKNKGIVVDPTLATFDFLKKVDGTVGEPWQAIVDHLPPDVQRRYAAAELDIPDAATAALYAKSYAKMVEFVGMMYKAGIPVVAGTDELAGFTLQGELELLVKAGLTPAQALQVATLNGARYSKVEATKGQIAVGKDADLLLVEGDPTKNIGDIRKLALVITQGKAMYPTDIYQALGIKPFVSDKPVIEREPLPQGNASNSAKHGHRHMH